VWSCQSTVTARVGASQNPRTPWMNRGTTTDQEHYRLTNGGGMNSPSSVSCPTSYFWYLTWLPMCVR
jgi:hypothetical protein